MRVCKLLKSEVLTLQLVVFARERNGKRKRKEEERRKKEITQLVEVDLLLLLTSTIICKHVAI